MSPRIADAFREGSVPEKVRRTAAEGGLSIPAPEKLEILVLLAADADHTIGEAAQKTLQGMKAEELLPVLSSAETPAAVLEFAANHLIFGRKDIADALLTNTALAPALHEWINQAIAFEHEAAVAAASEPPPAPAVAPVVEAVAPGEEDKERVTLLQRVSRMSAAEKIKAALTGNQEERRLLIRDSNKVVARAVLQSPKLSGMEVESFAAMTNVTEEVLRLIALSRKFAKSYGVVRSLLNNPRLPIDVGLPLLNRLNERDVKGLMLNRNVAEVIRGMAAKIIKMKEEASKPKLPGKKH